MNPSKQLPAIEVSIVFMSALVVDGIGRAKCLTALGGCNDGWCVTGLGNYSDSRRQSCRVY